MAPRRSHPAGRRVQARQVSTDKYLTGPNGLGRRVVERQIVTFYSGNVHVLVLNVPRDAA